MKIVTDWAADMSADELRELGIEEAPVYIQFPEGEVKASDITADAFYDRLEAMRPAIPTTAMPSSGLFAEIYRKISKFDPHIFSMHISSGLSGTIGAARNGAEEAKPDAQVDLWDRIAFGDYSRCRRLESMRVGIGRRLLSVLPTGGIYRPLDREQYERHSPVALW